MCPSAALPAAASPGRRQGRGRAHLHPWSRRLAGYRSRRARATGRAGARGVGALSELRGYGESLQRRVVIIGGGIAGLAAAYAISCDAPPNTSVVVVEGSSALGGTLRTSAIAGINVDEGAESLLARVPEAVALADAVGLGDELVAPATTAAAGPD